MQKKLIARTAKLHSEPKKGRRFKGIAVTYEHIPQDLEERNHGSIYAVINVNSENPEAEEIANLIIDTFHGEFYNNLHKPAEQSFEHALAKINEELADATHQGYIDWLNNLNAVLGVLSNNVLHVTQIGKAEVYLYRGEKSSHITEDLSGDSVNPLRTFINIASGELQEGDKVAVVTPSVFYHISKDELKRYTCEFQPKVAISHIADLLEGTSNEMNPNAVLLIEAITPEAASNETLEDQPDEIWISESSKPVEAALETATPIAKKIVGGLVVAWGASKAFAVDKVVPLVKDSANLAKDSFSKVQKVEKPSLKKKEKVIIDTEEDILSAPLSHKELSMTAEADGSIITAEKIETKGNEIFIKETHTNTRKLPTLDFTSIKKASSKALTYSKKLTEKYDRKNLLIVGVAVFAVLLISVTLVWRQRENAEALKLANASYTEAESKYEIGRNAVSSGNRGQGATNLNEAKKITEELQKNKTLKDKAVALLANINKALDEAENIVRPSVDEVADVSEIVGGSPFGPYAVGDNLFLINPDNSTIAAVNTKNNEVSNVLDKPKVEGKIAAATAVTARSVIVLATDNGALYEFDTKATTFKKQDVAGDLEKIVALSSFSTNIYSLTSDGKVYKRTKTSTGYSRSTEYITDGNYLANAKDIKIDSNIYVASENGSIYQYLSGKKQNFALYDIPSTINKSNGIFTDEETEGIYQINSEKNRIVKYDSKGKFISQFTNDNFSNIKGVFAKESNKTLYILSGSKVLKFSY